jgi:hypothetical protein
MRHDFLALVQSPRHHAPVRSVVTAEDHEVHPTLQQDRQARPVDVRRPKAADRLRCCTSLRYVPLDGFHSRKERKRRIDVDGVRDNGGIIQFRCAADKAAGAGRIDDDKADDGIARHHGRKDDASDCAALRVHLGRHSGHSR